MPITVLNLATAFLTRVAALYLVLTKTKYWEVNARKLLLLAMFSTFLGLIAPSGAAITLASISGIIFRITLFTAIIFILTGLNISESFSAVIMAAIIEFVMLMALSISPAAFLVQGMSPFTIP